MGTKEALGQPAGKSFPTLTPQVLKIHQVLARQQGREERFRPRAQRGPVASRRAAGSGDGVKVEIGGEDGERGEGWCQVEAFEIH